jgi:uracil phosphoribosyltransferase
MKSLKFDERLQEILEALYIDPTSNKLQFNYSGKDGLKVTQGKGKGMQFEPFSSKSKDFGGSEVISLFSTSHVKGSAREQIVTPIMKALKGQSTTEVDQAELKKWLKSAAYVMGRYLRTNVKPDAILAVKSSSQLNNLFVKELANNLPGVAIIPDAIGKADINKIKVSANADEKQKKAVERELKKAKAAGVLSFKKIHVSLRPFFKGVMEVDKVAQNIEGKTVVVLDDIMTTRATQTHAIDVVRQYNPKEIVGVTLFKQ